MDYFLNTLLQKEDWIKNRKIKASKIIKILKMFVSLNDKKVLDIGCSVGIISDAVASHSKLVVGIDTDIPAVSYANSYKQNNMHFLIANGTNLPFKTEIFDVIICNNVIEYVFDQNYLLKEMNKVLSSEGICYFTCINKLKFIPTKILPSRLKELYIKLVHKETNYGNPLYYYQLKNLLLSNNFDMDDLTMQIIKKSHHFLEGDHIPFKKISSYVPLSLLRILSPLSPSWIFILKKH